MSMFSYAPKLFKEFVRFGRERKMYWIIPFALLLGIATAVVVVTQGVAPLLYTLF
jgi:hypothetical protein